MPLLDRAAIAARIPHTGRMCLLERVIHWDQNVIRCAAISHRDTDNPLRDSQGLPVWAAIEYAAQAAAVHGALLHPQTAPRVGVLAALRNVNVYCERLDIVHTELMFSASLLHSDSAGAIYRFEAHGGEKLLIDGQFTLMFKDRKQVREG